MTPPEWPAGVDYDEWVGAITDCFMEGEPESFRGQAERDASDALDTIAPLVAKAVEGAEADAERLAERLRRRIPLFERDSDALAAHEARKAGR